MPDGSAFVYSETIKAEPTTADMPTQNGDQGTAIGSASDTRVPQNSFGVNSYDMQNGGENSQFSFGGVNGTDINVRYEGDAEARGVEVAAPYDGGNAEAANSKALGIW